MEYELDELRDQLASLSRKYEKLKKGYRSQILVELKKECKLIPLTVAKSGLFEEDLERILGDE